MRLVVGLGNPGSKYDLTRHNIGFRALDRFLAGRKLRARKRIDDALTVSAVLGGEEVWFVKPQTFMNLSGWSVSRFAERLKADPAETLVLHDEADLEEGRLQLKKGGGTGGHRGLDSIVMEWEEQDFYRLRIGIGKPPGADLTEFVLQAAPAELLDRLAGNAAEAVEKIFRFGPELAMNRINARPREPAGEAPL